MIRWQTDNDTFEPGQWLRGRVYERRCDISPDGTQFVYFAHKMHRGFAFTALCAPPNFTAMEFWEKDNTWGGGGTFDAHGELTLNANRGEDEPIQSKRVALHGWTRVQASGLRSGWTFDPPEIWERQIDRHVLRRIVLGWDAQVSSGWIELFEIDGRDLPRVTWADFDQRGRLVYARDGKIFANDTELADFNAMEP